MGYFWGRCSVQTVEQLLFSIVSQILTFDFDLILWSFLTFLGPKKLLFGDLGKVRIHSWGLFM